MTVVEIAVAGGGVFIAFVLGTITSVPLFGQDRERLRNDYENALQRNCVMRHQLNDARDALENAYRKNCRLRRTITALIANRRNKRLIWEAQKQVLLAENERLRADFLGAAGLNARMLSRPGFDPHICPKTPISPDEFRKTQMYWFRRYLCAEEYGRRMERRYASLSAAAQRQGNETASLLINEVAQHSMSQRRTDRLRRHVEKLLEVNRRRKQERDALKARVAQLEQEVKP